MATFLLTEARTSRPILPLSLFTRRNRVGAYVNLVLIAAVLTSMWFFLAQFLQEALGHRSLADGHGLPSGGSHGLRGLAGRTQAPHSAEPVASTGLFLVAAASLWLTQLTTDTGYVEGVRGPMLLFGFGAGLTLAPHDLTAVSETSPGGTGVASGALQPMVTVG